MDKREKSDQEKRYFYIWIRERYGKRKLRILNCGIREMRTGKTVFLYMDKGERWSHEKRYFYIWIKERISVDRISHHPKEDHIMDLILLAGVAVIDLLVVLGVKSMCEFVYKNIKKYHR